MIEKVWEWLKALIVAAVIVAIIGVFFGSTAVLSTSMYPTLVEGDHLVLFKKGTIERGDIITFKSNLKITESDIAHLNILRKLMTKAGDEKILIKRVVGLPGDHLVIRDGKVIINEKRYDESLYVDATTTGDVDVVLNDKEYFVMGDNRDDSIDSRFTEVGVVHEDKIQGRVMFRIYPFSRIKIFRGL